jgi:hypothetical protein
MCGFSHCPPVFRRGAAGPARCAVEKAPVWVGRSMSRRRLCRLRRLCQRTLYIGELGLALDDEKRHLGTAARSAPEQPAVERCPVVGPRLQQPEGYGAAVAVRADRQQGQAASAAGDRAGGVSRDLDHGAHGSRRSTARPHATVHRLSAETPAGGASSGSSHKMLLGGAAASRRARSDARNRCISRKRSAVRSRATKGILVR